MLVLNHQRLRKGVFQALGARIRDRIVSINVNGIDLDEEAGSCKVVDSREVLSKHFQAGLNHLLVGNIFSKFHQRLTATSPNGCRFVEVQELCTAFPEQVPLSAHRQSHLQKIKATRLALEERLALAQLKFPPQMHGIFLTSSIGIQMWDEAIQVMMDYQSTEDGRISSVLQDPQREPTKGVAIHIPFFLPPPKGLLGINHFIDSFRSVHQLIYKRPVPNLIQHGLPELLELAYSKYGKPSTKELLVDSSLTGTALPTETRLPNLRIRYVELSERDTLARQLEELVA